ncbi:clavata3/esr (cle)-related protein 13 [Phtheirospermum japonicum]|uniref:Clavata3/esr (Cle)-related protein 13 n=1 Tax=Phtheirospermum japonicum TaxID=374723 RepID=A0A830C8Q7_9LAMI|nr:clavata3/esr (cle)-related protein 13 [Phtheirospermum japonicum]
MIMKPPLLLYPFLWLFLILILFHESYHFKNLRNTSLTNGSSNLERKRLLIPHRKALASKFDFTPFLKRHHHRQRSNDPPGRSKIDPRYGEEKRLVPSGPNPLHH